jgi:hypothetical protein
MSEEDRRRHHAAAHAMQTGVAYEHQHDPSDGSPKHLRTGINCAMSDHAGLVRLLISKGVITEDEYTKFIADSMEEEKAAYEARLSERFGKKITLG